VSVAGAGVNATVENSTDAPRKKIVDDIR